MKFLTVFIGCVLLNIYTYAQKVNDTSTYKYGFNKKTVVTNKAGKPYAYANWSKLISTGNYGLKPINAESDSTAFILYKRDEETESKTFANLPKPPESTCFKNGDTFKFFDVKDINGVAINGADLAGKIVVVNFWFIACPICRYEMPELNRLVDSYKNNKDVVFIAYAIDNKKDLDRFLKLSPFKYHVIEDTMPRFYFYGIKECPVSVVIDRTGVEKFHCVGYGEGAAPYWIKKTIEEIRSNKKAI